MKIEAVFFDIDGTLVDMNTRRIPKSTFKALNQLREKGIKLFICSGRNPLYRKQLDKELSFTFDGYVFANGQWITDKEGNCIYKGAFDNSTKEKLYQYFTEHKNIFVNICIGNGFYTNNAFTLNPLIVRNPKDIKNMLKDDVYQITIFEHDDKDKEIEKATGSKCTGWGNGVDIIPVDGGKDKGIEKILKILNIDKKYTMAFGDGQNDIPMFNAVNLSVAMAGANDIVKKSAKYVTDSVMRDGIYKALKENEVI